MFKKILTICPTRQRSKVCQRMFDSFLMTSSQSDIIFVLDDNDPYLQDYGFIFKNPANFVIGSQTSITKVFNTIFTQNPDYEFYHLTNDDFVYQTVGWDKIFIDKLINKGGGIAYGNDLCVGQGLCTAPVISGDIVRAIGWLQLPALTHLYGDVVWKLIGHRIDRLFYFKDVIIEHRHTMNGKAEIDDIYKKTNSKEMYQKDDQAFGEWLIKQSHWDIEKIKQCFKGVGV